MDTTRTVFCQSTDLVKLSDRFNVITAGMVFINILCDIYFYA
jgi:hypothetical protein